MAIEDDVTIKINVHELRILAIWAENHAVTTDQQRLDDPSHESMKLTVNKIATEIEKQIEEQLKQYIPITLTHELQDLPKHIKCGEITLIRGGKEEMIDEELS